MSNSPIVLFVYNRSKHTRRMLECLMKNKEFIHSEILIFSDGSKSKKDAIEVLEVRKIISDILKDYKYTLFKSDVNKGLNNSIKRGLEYVFSIHERAIFIEDDICVSPGFLKYMNTCLDLYSTDESIHSVSGYMFPVYEGSNSSLFLPWFFCWGWGTWKKTWENVDWDIELPEPDVMRTIENRFNIGDYRYSDILKDIGTWDILWYYDLFIKNKMCINPKLTLVENIGFDGSGTYTVNSSIDKVLIADSCEVINKNSLDVEMMSLIIKYFTNTKKRFNLFKK